MKNFIIIFSLICMTIPLILLFKELKEANSNKEKIGMFFGFFFEPLEPWAMLFYVGFFGLLYGILV
jgi:hypothetical protein